MIPLSDVNLVAVVIATIACMALGFFWYSPKVFGETWIKLTGLDKQALKEGDRKCGMAQGLLATLISNYFLAVLLLLTDAGTAVDAAKIAAVLWAATALPLELHGVAWEKRPVQLLYVNGANSLLTFILGAVVIQTLS